MKLYYAQNTRAVRIAWALEELGLAYEIEPYKLGDPAMRSDEFREISPLGRVPVLDDGDIRITESGAIMEYLLSRHGSLRPQPDSPDFPTYLQWLHYCEGMIMPQINIIVVETILLPPERRSETNYKRAAKLLGNMLAVVEAHMTGRNFLAGDFSGADMMTGHSVIVSRDMIRLDFSAYPALDAYASQLLERPALQRAMSL
jgi:glutathione S-transferase